MPNAKEVFDEYYYYAIVSAVALLVTLYNVFSGPHEISGDMLVDVEKDPERVARYQAGLDPYIETHEVSGQRIICAEASGRFRRDLAAIRAMAEAEDMSILPATYFLISAIGETEERGLLRSLRETAPTDRMCLWGD